MLAVFALDGHRKELAVVAYINIEYTLAEGEGIDDFRVFHILIEPDEGLRSAVGEQTVQVVGGIVINDVVDALEVLPFHHFFLFQVIDHQATHLGVVAGENEALAVFVQGHEGRIVELDTVQVGHLPQFLRDQVQFGDMREAPRCVHGRIGLAGSGIVHKGRYRAQRIPGERVGGRQGILPHGGQIGLLVLPFGRSPVVPNLAQRLSIDGFKLVAEVGAAVGGPVIETDQVVVSVFRSQVIDKSGTVQIGIGTHLKVHCGTFRFQTHHGKHFFPAAHNAAEIHFVVPAQGATGSAAHPGFQETGDAFMVPARSVPSGNGQVTPQGGNGLGVVGPHLGAENVPPHPVAGIVFVAHDQVGIFVAEQLAVPFAGRGDVIRHGHRRHAELDVVLRQRGGAAVAVVFPVGYQDQRRLHHIDGVRCPHLLVEGLAVLEHPDHVGNVSGQILVKKN